jgi:signal transduction histidine kinase
VAAQLNRTVDDLQATIDDIRKTIFQLQSAPGPDDQLRRRIQDTVADLTQDRGIASTVHISGPLSAVGAEVAEHGEAVTAEAVSWA